MVVSLTIKCDWHGCRATVELPCHEAAEERGWKQESYGLFSLHLCPEHRRHNWLQVREQTEAIAAPSTGNHIENTQR